MGWQTFRSHYWCLPYIDHLRCCLESRAFLKGFQGKTMPVQAACCLGSDPTAFQCLLWALSEGHWERRRQERSIPLEYGLAQSGDDSCFMSQDALIFHVFVTFYSHAKYVELNCTNHNAEQELNKTKICFSQPYQARRSSENTSKTYNPGKRCALL